ncbi:phosphoribosylaminoimidazolesuccinocarboxamide synthase [Helicobacter kayseriensis]|uniref:phosphoribosylaminoimidazolesuccinocarboxamide synthase n=1 Tax=Helicobacter kayseriensis TaxID=2905877 RepID=UPI001E2F65CB|nr:phosphoribosylaminoimidazolesuccinocarboxamide synthase [Helicobacter kayseriensis]MCE3047123.1 phosphoribosylaminoimidazolesuccinocarboxamide synthase [Helicobacter kayseriensis]MCE3048494.1 phosphoribosylaminoimidazolesuccinocarboxamide synthase [Helicobacter kayseriensis]
MTPTKQAPLYEGKAKKVYATKDSQSYIVSYKDDATAFNGLKKDTIKKKGELNNRITNLLMQMLHKHAIPTHFIQELSPTDSLVKKLTMFPLEVIVRNFAAGSITKRLGIKEGEKFERPILEFCYKNDALGDPMINTDHILALKLAQAEEIDAISSYALQINTLLSDYFASMGILLVDFKLEFGKDEEGKIILGDEISPDTCRFWDAQTKQKLDKDRFREDLGDVSEAYEIVLQKILAKESK